MNTLTWMLRRVFESESVDCVIDIGANVGQFARSLRDLGFQGRIASVEPSPDSFAALKASMVGDSAWVGYRFAMGANSGSASLLRHATSEHDSLLSPSAFGRERHGYVGDGTIVDTVQVRTLDEAWAELVGESRSVFVKTDAQGLDLAIIGGASQRLSEIRGAVIEVQSKPTYDGAPRLPEVMKAMNGLGFEECGFFPVTRVRGGLALVTCDVVFVRSQG